MPDDKKKLGPLDGERIDINDRGEVAYWTEELGCSEEKLKEAVETVGTSVEKVRKYLDN